MPELPEVEAARSLLHTHCVSAKIVSAQVEDDEIVCDGCTPKEVQKVLEGAKLVAVHRRGKHLWFELDKRPQPLFHFGMTGSFVVENEAGVEYKSFKVDHETWPPRFHKVCLELDNGKRVAFTDARRFARIRLREDPAASPPISDLGFDPVHDDLPLEEFAKRLGARKAPVKAVLLDQAFVAG
eukprot:CAMPEP_0118944534 /NCGR_PEP_ID=MMETSP1169-20130426/40492_1 /TAXON_ID=36882 /ORGANISM="Pyramimonas obovata, Strain CCMP722" /LENGTH=182 /DNA_ID=CAMNT_0006890037 /DNA_START=36 /DNA_END=580 /DNA_ORIENTATION=+